MPRPRSLKQLAATALIRQQHRTRNVRVSGATKAYVQRAIRGQAEHKYKDTQQAAVDVSSTPQFIDLSAISQGDSETTRDGDVCKPFKLQFRAQIVRDSGGTTDTWDNVRIILFTWKDDTADNSPSTLSDLLHGSGTNSHLALPAVNYSIKSKFNILYDRMFTLTDRNAASIRPIDGRGPYRNISVNIYGKRKFAPIYFTSGATTGKNKVYLLVYSTQAAGADNSRIYYQSILHFKDLKR